MVATGDVERMGVSASPELPAVRARDRPTKVGQLSGGGRVSMGGCGANRLCSETAVVL